MGHVRPKTCSLGQVLEKLCVCSRGLILTATCEILKELKNGLCLVKN